MGALVEQVGDWKIELATWAGECERPVEHMLYNGSSSNSTS